MSGPTLRLASREDLDAVVAIERESFGDPWSRASFGALLRDAGGYFVVCEHAGAVVGYVAGWTVLDQAEIANVAVRRDARGAGIGRRLVEAALEEAGRRGVVQMFLEVREGNAAARSLYASMGFEPVGRRRRYYRNPVEDALVLRRTLPLVAVR